MSRYRLEKTIIRLVVPEVDLKRSGVPQMGGEVVGVLLAVEDEPEVRQLTVLFAESLGFRTYQAEDGDKAIEMIKSHNPDIIISDMKMPKKDGMELLKELRDSGNQTPFLFVSAFTGKEYTVRALSLGAFDYLEKPFMPNELKALLNEMLRVSKAQRSILSKSTTLPSTLSTGTISPEAEILKMSTLRGDQTEPSPISQINLQQMDRNTRLIKMFVAEARNQLTHGLKALTELRHSEAPGWQLGYLFRLMYSIRTTAGSLNLSEVKDLAYAIEQAYVLLRVRTSYLNKMTLATLQVSHELLRRLIDVLENAPSATPEEQKLIQDEVKLVIADLKAVAAPK